jgi:hypothetical protein
VAGPGFRAGQPVLRIPDKVRLPRRIHHPADIDNSLRFGAGLQKREHGLLCSVSAVSGTWERILLQGKYLQLISFKQRVHCMPQERGAARAKLHSDCPKFKADCKNSNQSCALFLTAQYFSLARSRGDTDASAGTGIGLGAFWK